MKIMIIVQNNMSTIQINMARSWNFTITTNLQDTTYLINATKQKIKRSEIELVPTYISINTDCWKRVRLEQIIVLWMGFLMTFLHALHLHIRTIHSYRPQNWKSIIKNQLAHFCSSNNFNLQTITKDIINFEVSLTCVRHANQ